MNKKVFIFVLAFILVIPSFANAEPIQPSSIAVLDTAIDTSIPLFKDKIIYEACVMEWSSCPNKQSTMEGPGSATIPISLMKRNGFAHGTQMVSALVKTNPNIKIVFVRIVGLTFNGSRKPVSEITLARALDWVILNKDKFNIQAVSMSQGNHNLPNVLEYCPKTVSTRSRIRSLVSLEIPVFLPTGNTGDHKRIDWPACIDESISVGASDTYESIPIWSNIDINKTDFYALGNMDLIGPGNISTKQLGTSISAQVAVANWMALKELKPDYNYKQLYDAFKKTAVKISNPKYLQGDMMYLKGAIDG